MQMTDEIIVGARYRGVQRDHPWLVQVLKTSARFVEVLKAHSDQCKKERKIPLTTFRREYRRVGRGGDRTGQDGSRC